jgi:hypothetical protein
MFDSRTSMFPSAAIAVDGKTRKLAGNMLFAENLS